jgi:ATP-dependent exoDNAse (exonuclease V) beta subunit
MSFLQLPQANKTEQLEVYVADLKFQLVSKMERAYYLQSQRSNSLEAKNRGTKDFDDVISILDKLIQENGGSWDQNEVAGWYSGIYSKSDMKLM